MLFGHEFDKKKAVMAGLGGLLAIALIGGGVWYASSQKPEPKDVYKRQDFRYGKVTEWLWAKKNDDGTDYGPGRRAVLYKHNDPPKEGDMSSCLLYTSSSLSVSRTFRR